MKWFALFAAVSLAVAAHAQLGPEIAHKHAARAGGRLAALTALRAEGRTFVNDEVVPFSLVAQRPNRLRVESGGPLHRAVQGCDGVNPPWISRPGIQGGAPQDMSEAEARDFIANADFDGPLVDFAAKNYSVDYAGEEPIGGRPAFKLLVMNKSDDIFFLWVDTETYEVVKRTVYRVFDGQRVAVDTFFKDFREVGGVLQPYRIETSANGRPVYVILIDRMEANPAPVGPETFRRPAAD
jgi:outer membrane lipoprotein-sorting protein